MRAKTRIAAGVVAFLSAVLLAAPAQAGGANYAKAWDSSFGAKWNGYVQIQEAYSQVSIGPGDHGSDQRERLFRS